MVKYLTEEESFTGHIIVFIVDCLIILYTTFAFGRLDVRKKTILYTGQIGLLASFLNSLLTLVLDIRIWGPISVRLYLVAAVFYLITWVCYIFLVYMESGACGILGTNQRNLVAITMSISLLGLVPAVAFFLYATVVGYSFEQVYYWGIPVVLFNPVFDFTVFYLIRQKLYLQKGWSYPWYLLTVASAVLVSKLWLLVIVATPILSLYCQFEELAMHLQVLGVMLVFRDIQSNFELERELSKAHTNKSETRGSTGKLSKSIKASRTNLEKSQRLAGPSYLSNVSMQSQNSTRDLSENKSKLARSDSRVCV